MTFYLETTDMDLGDTPIENIFINDFMPMANGTYVKVYLLGFKYAHDKDSDIEVGNGTIARHLNIPMEDVLRAWDFWEDKGIIEKVEIISNTEYQVKFLNLKQLYIKNNIGLFMEKQKNDKKDNYKKEEVKSTSNMEELVSSLRIPEISSMFNNIDNIMRRQTVPQEKNRILSWISDYNMSPEVIEKAFFYSVEVMDKKNLSYISAVVRNWYDEGITTLEDVMEVFEKNNKKYYRYQKIMKSLGLDRRPIKDKEKETIDKWIEEYEYDMDLILEACERDKTANPSIAYVNGVLSSWNKKGIKKVDDIEELDVKESYKDNEVKKGYVSGNKRNKTKFHNFEQRSDRYSSDELEEIAQRKRREYMKRKLNEGKREDV